MAGWFFEAPGGVNDFTRPQDWHDAMADEAFGIVYILASSVLGRRPTALELQQLAPQLGYVDPVTHPPTTAGETLAIAPWPAFPRGVVRRGPWTSFPPHSEDLSGNFRAAEELGYEDIGNATLVDGDGTVLDLPVRHRQDEYLEWTVRRNASGKISKVIFVAEGYDYFAQLFENDEQKVVELYRDFTEVGSITADDLRAPKGVYRQGTTRAVVEPGAFNPRNRFNISPGIVHLSHRANSLGAEVNLAGVSGILRLKANGTLLAGDDPEELICCNEGGDPNRNSDPLIAQQAYAQVKGGYRYTLANPVGLYIAAAEHERVQTKNGEPLTDDWWTVVRGSGFNTPASRVLRLELAPPPGSNLTLEDLEVDGVPVRFGGQLADLLLIHLFVTRWTQSAGAVGPQIPCTGTACRLAGSSQLYPTTEPCPPGYQLAFPGLIAGPGGPLPPPQPTVAGFAAAAGAAMGNAKTRK